MFDLRPANALRYAASPFRYYLDVISKWDTAPALSCFWYLYFDLGSVGALKNLIADASKYNDGDYQPWSVGSDVISTLVSGTNQGGSNQRMGCVFARSVSVPGENINVSRSENFASYLSPSISEGRKSLTNCKIQFLETHSSFVDFVIRPWMTLVSQHGLVARMPGSDKDVKCKTLDIIEMAKTGPYNSMTIRKVVKLFDVVPVSIGSSSLNQNNDLITNDVQFAFNSYSVYDS
jgi:hypothetical protein